jgi:hypothetical protein
MAVSNQVDEDEEMATLVRQLEESYDDSLLEEE